MITIHKKPAIKLKIIRELLKHDQKTMAKLLDLSQPTYSRLESGVAEIGFKSLDLLFNSVGVNPLWFFVNDQEPVFMEGYKVSDKCKDTYKNLNDSFTFVAELASKQNITQDLEDLIKKFGKDIW